MARILFPSVQKKLTRMQEWRELHRPDPEQYVVVRRSLSVQQIDIILSGLVRVLEHVGNWFRFYRALLLRSSTLLTTDCFQYKGAFHYGFSCSFTRRGPPPIGIALQDCTGALTVLSAQVVPSLDLAIAGFRAPLLSFHSRMAAFFQRFLSERAAYYIALASAQP